MVGGAVHIVGRVFDPKRNEKKTGLRCGGANTLLSLEEHGLSVFDVLKNNDAYHALQVVDGLIVTGPTGTNVNDVAVALLRG